MDIIPYLVIALITVYVGYVSIVTAIHGVLRSISRSFYTLRENKRGGWFRAMMFTSGILLILITAFAGYPFAIAFTLYLSGIGAILTGAAAMYYKEITGIVHYISSGVMLVFALVFLGLVFSWIPLLIVIVGFLIVIKYKNSMPNPVFWFEVYSFNTVVISLFWWSLTL